MRREWSRLCASILPLLFSACGSSGGSGFLFPHYTTHRRRRIDAEPVGGRAPPRGGSWLSLERGWGKSNRRRTRP